MQWMSHLWRNIPRHHHYYCYYHYYHHHHCYYYYHYYYHYYDDDDDYHYYYHSINNIPYQCDINCAGRFTLDALASRPVACPIWCAILIAHQLLWQNIEVPVSIFQESPLAGEPRERLFHIHSVHSYQLCAKYLYPSTLLWQINCCNL